MHVAVLFARLGPYHVARLRALSDRCRVTAVELSGENLNYDWDEISADGLRRTVLVDRNHRTVAASRLRGRLWEVLDQTEPTVVAVPGWWDPGALIAIEWACDRGVPVVLMSDSTRHDGPRVWWREAIKRRVVSLCQSGFAAGQRHVHYLRGLGMAPNRITTGYDVVENTHFVAGAETARKQTGLRNELGLPDRYFMCCARFVEKKNLSMLVRAYARYRKRVGTAAWKLVLVGDGPLRESLEQEVRALGLGRDVSFPGFQTYEDLPAYYGLADAFVLPSRYEQWGLVVNEAMASGLLVLVSENCGCAPDLVAEGENGWTFAPEEPETLAQLMGHVSGEDIDRGAMGRASRDRIRAWSPDTFAENMTTAAETARQQDKPSLALIDRFLLRALVHKVLLSG